MGMLGMDPSYSLVILDLALPGISGSGVLKRLRSSVSSAALPVLIRTGTGNDVAEAELLDAGADDYITKATDPNRFQARVRAILRRAVI